MRANHGSRSCGPVRFKPAVSFQWASVRAGVRKLEVQFTVVPPPTQRPCRIVIDLSVVCRAELSW